MFSLISLKLGVVALAEQNNQHVIVETEQGKFAVRFKSEKDESGVIFKMILASGREILLGFDDKRCLSALVTLSQKEILTSQKEAKMSKCDVLFSPGDSYKDFNIPPKKLSPQAEDKTSERFESPKGLWNKAVAYCLKNTEPLKSSTL